MLEIFEKNHKKIEIDFESENFIADGKKIYFYENNDVFVDIDVINNESIFNRYKVDLIFELNIESIIDVDFKTFNSLLENDELEFLGLIILTLK